jgi:hypothetical protein
MNRYVVGLRVLSVTLTLGTLLSFCSTDVIAQKSHKTQAAPAKQSTLKDVLTQYVGKDTSLGKLVKISADYFTVESEGGEQSMHPLSVIHTLKIVKPEEGSTVVLEIMLVDRD